jgi:alkanesulfonate monooxygenase SsuD/methylene tetrahydromethanopterin reductase-like flavin-dependent oxidoreductase (luciferase family)
LGQHLGSRATLSPRGLSQEILSSWTAEQTARRLQDDDLNREIFEEQIDLVLRAWELDAIESDGRWQIPSPRREGIEWTMNATRELGAVGEMDDDNRIRRVAVVPALFRSERPPIFVSSNASKETVEYCGSRGFIPAYFSKPERVVEYGQAYVDEAAKAGRNYTLGQNQAIVRWGQIGQTDDEAYQNIARYDADIFQDLYVGTTPMTWSASDPVGSILASGLWTAGSVGQVKDAYADLWKRMPAEYVVLIYHFAQQPLESVIEQMSLFVEHVKPILDDLTSYQEFPA